MSAGATICGFYGRNNLGDEAILGGMIDLLARARPAEPPQVMSDDPSSTRAAHGVGAFSGRTSRRTRHIAGLRVAKAMVGRRDFILGGGDLLRDSPHQDVVGPWLSFLERAQQLKRRSAVVGISVGDLWRPESLERIRSRFEKVSFVITRDQPSATRLCEIGVQTEILVGPDLALRLFPRRNTPARDPRDKRVIVCVRSLADRAEEDSVIAHERAVVELAAALDVLSADGVEVHLVPLRSMCGRLQPVDDDYVASLELAHRARRGHTFTVHRHIATVAALRDVLTTADLVIGMRLHSIIMAAGLGIPALAMAYDQKVSQFCAEVDLDACSQLGATGRLVLVDQARERLSDTWDASERPKMARYRARSVSVEERLRTW